MALESPTSSSSATAPSPNAEPATASEEGLEPSFGWTRYAEQINGRFAMIGFVALLVTEFVTRQDFFTWIGLR